MYPAPGENSEDVFTATYNSGISRSHDLGETWPARISASHPPLPMAWRVAGLRQRQNDLCFGHCDGLYRSSNAGHAWSKVSQVDTAKVIGKPVLNRKLGVSPEFGDDGLIFLFSVPRRILGDPEKHVWKFNDKTKELKQISIGRDNNYINGFAFSRKDPSRS